MRIQNNTRETLSFNLKGKAKDGHPPTGSIAPGEVEDLDVDPEDAQFKGRVVAGAISVPAKVAEKVEATVAVEAPAKGK
ncbi:hypothetical protein FHR70_003729 [Microvirga lupini]|uniref:Uncharacterized protein n=1 Tax=Microvirga lupini TaxID=420324 RepID=A0A7W4VNX1_9HYPH|nr:hypothetical protein [Microvirga lupini]MBB3020643.1 hypothetical protein [Microvirga lupini]